MKNQKPNYEVIFRKLQDRYPAIADELNYKPILSDLGLMGKLYHEFSEIAPEQKNRYDMEVLFTCVILYLYDYEVLEGYKLNTLNRLNQELAKVLNITSRRKVANRVKIAKEKFEIYRNFREQVIRISDYLVSEDLS